MWATDSLNGGLSELNWPAPRSQLTKIREVWIDQILTHAKDNDVFFPQPDDEQPVTDSTLVTGASRGRGLRKGKEVITE